MVLFLAVNLVACVSTRDNILGTPQTQVQMRNYQSRSFETNDKTAVLRALIATMQDLGFIIEKTDEKLGLVSGTSFSNGSKATASVRTIRKKTVVRLNAQSGLRPITNPITYQNFFNSLEQSLFLDANEIE
ncbi:MAG: hypothetical protein ACOX3T_05820 [Bdellovibrionota bacterium]